MIVAAIAGVALFIANRRSQNDDRSENPDV
jgi:hypothetical protein